MKDLIQFFKLPPKILLAITIGVLSILFLPLKILQKLGIANISKQWRTVLGLVLIITIALLIVHILYKIHEIIKEVFHVLYFKWNFPKIMLELREEELRVVALLYKCPNYTSRLPSTDGVTIRLLSKNVIQFTSSTNICYGDELIIPFTITPVTQKYIDKNPKLIQKFNYSELKELYRKYNVVFY